jgi:predicted NUDIX family NTP pyrophosphohydrolase
MPMAGRRSAGILLFRRRDGNVEVLLAHMGGPLWARRDAGAWTIPKGEYDDTEDAEQAARREFAEELGLPVPEGHLHHLGAIRQSGGKMVTAFALEGELDPEMIEPGTFAMEWPRGSGRMRRFPEVDRVAWLDLDAARERIVTGQRTFLDRLAAQVGG